jgi:hypothetical protein
MYAPARAGAADPRRGRKGDRAEPAQGADDFRKIAGEARLQQIDSLEKVKWAVLESSGRISFIPR